MDCHLFLCLAGTQQTILRRGLLVFSSLINALPQFFVFLSYNHYMNGVDLANQYRVSYEVHRKGVRNWLPLPYFFIDAAIINAYRIQYIYKQQ